MNHLDLFSGIGGFSLAAQWVWGENHYIHRFIEIDLFCQKVLKKHWPNVPVHDDIRTYNHDGTKVDLLTGGFPCQPFSVAGKQRGKKDDRYLWPEMLRVITEVKPTWIIGENVAGIVRMELDKVLSDLEDQGYEAQPLIIPACAVDAPHRRDRVWIVAYSKGKRLQGSSNCENRTGCSGKNGTSNKFTRNGATNNSKAMADAESKNGARILSFTGRKSRTSAERKTTGRYSSNKIGNEWTVEPDVGGIPDGFPVWLYRHCGRGLSYEESQRRTTILRELWDKDVAKTLWQAIGGFNRIQKAEILFSFVRQYETHSNKTRLLLESKEAFKRFVRGLWKQGKITGSSYRSEDRKQLQGEYSDSMQILSRLLAFNGKENWQISDWEDGISRIATGVPRRVDRLRSLGNAIVPQIVVPIMEGIKALS